MIWRVWSVWVVRRSWREMVGKVGIGLGSGIFSSPMQA